MKDKLISEAEKAINLSEAKQAAQDMKEYIPSIAKMTMDIFKGFKNEGFTDVQSFDFAKEYALKILFK